MKRQIVIMRGIRKANAPDQGNQTRVTLEHVSDPAFMAQHDGVIRKYSPGEPTTLSFQSGGVRSNLIRFVQGLKRKSTESGIDSPIPVQHFYRRAVSSGVHPEELHMAGIFPERQDSRSLEAEHTPAGWENTINQRLPEMRIENANTRLPQPAFNAGLVGNDLVTERLGQHGYSISNLLEAPNTPDDVPLTSDNFHRQARILTMRGRFNDPSQDHWSHILHRFGYGHGDNPYVVMYKGTHLRDPNGDKHLIVEQIQSDWHQHKGQLLDHKDVNKIIRTSEPDHQWIDPEKDVRMEDGRKFNPDRHVEIDKKGRSYLTYMPELAGDVPDMPFGTREGEWENVALRMALYDAARFGHKGIFLPGEMWMNGKRNMDMLPGSVHRRQKVVLPREAATIVRDLAPFGATMEKREFLGFPNETLHYIPMTDAMREHLLTNGFTPWGTDGPHNIMRVIKALDEDIPAGLEPMQPARYRLSDVLKPDVAAEHPGELIRPAHSGNLETLQGGTYGQNISPKHARSGPIRYHSIRFAEGLTRKDAERGSIDRIGGERFYNMAINAGVKPEELHWAGFQSVREPGDYWMRKARSASEWADHLHRSLPMLHLDTGQNFNPGLAQNHGVKTKAAEAGYEFGPNYIHPDTGESIRNKPSEGAHHYDEMFGKLNRNSRVLRIANMDSSDRDGNRMALVNYANQRKAIHGHGKSYVVMYKSGVLADPDGNEHLVVDQIQSDWHQKKQALAREGIRIIPHEDPDHNTVSAENNVDFGIGPHSSHYAREFMKTHGYGAEGWDSAGNPMDDPEDVEHLHEGAIDLPFGRKNNGEWENVGIRMALFDAARAGMKGVFLPNPTWQNGLVEGEPLTPMLNSAVDDVVKFRNGRTIPEEAAKIVRGLAPLGATLEKREFPGTGEMTHYIPITDAMREHYNINGFTPWGDDAPGTHYRIIKAVDVN